MNRNYRHCMKCSWQAWVLGIRSMDVVEVVQNKVAQMVHDMKMVVDSDS